MALTWPVSSVLEAPPTGDQAWLDRALDWPRFDSWKLTVGPLPCTPRPLVGSGFWKVSDQPFKVPVVPVVEVLVRTSVQVPWTFMPCWPPVVGAKTLASDCWGS